MREEGGCIYVVVDRIARVYQWMNEPGKGRRPGSGDHERNRRNNKKSPQEILGIEIETWR